MSSEKPLNKSESSSFEDLATAGDIEEAKRADNSISETTTEWEDILGSGNLLKKILRKGDESEGLRPQRNNFCWISYEVKLRDNPDVTIEKREKVKIYVGDNELLQGMDLALTLMYKNELCIVQMEPRFAYGSKGLSSMEPLGYVHDFNEVYTGISFGADAWIEATMELHDFDEEDEHETLTIDQRMELGTRRRLRGNWWYARGEAQLSLQLYRRALDVLDESSGGITVPTASGELEKADEPLRKLLVERASVLNNMAAAHAMLGAHEAVLQSVGRALELQPNNAKALYRKARALWELSRADEALEACEKACAVSEEPSTALLRLKQKLAKQLRQAKIDEKLLAQRMFAATGKGDKTDAEKDDDKPKRKTWIWGSLFVSFLVAVGSVLFYKYRSRTFDGGN